MNRESSLEPEERSASSQTFSLKLRFLSWQTEHRRDRKDDGHARAIVAMRRRDA
jgi:hypothetical protein